MSGEMEIIDALTTYWGSFGIRRCGDKQWSVSLSSLGDQRGDTGIVYADDRETAYACINGGCRQVASGYHATRAAALADAYAIARRFEEIIDAAAVDFTPAEAELAAEG